MKLKPLGDRLIVKPIDEEETTASGIVLPDTAKEKPQKGKVIAAGEGRWDEDGEKRTFTGTMSNGRMSFIVREEDSVVATLKCDGDVKSSGEASGAFVVTIGSSRGSGKWKMKAQEKKASR